MSISGECAVLGDQGAMCRIKHSASLVRNSIKAAHETRAGIIASAVLPVLTT